MSRRAAEPVSRHAALADLPLFAAGGRATLANDPRTYGGAGSPPSPWTAPACAPASAAPDDFARAVRVPDYDVCAARHGGNRQSDAANERGLANRQGQRDRVLAAIRAAGSHGLTCKELARRSTPADGIAERWRDACLRGDDRGKAALKAEAARLGVAWEQVRAAIEALNGGRP